MSFGSFLFCMALQLRQIVSRCIHVASISVAQCCESLRAINVNYLVSDSINSGVFQSSPRHDALTRKLLLTYFAGIRSLPLLLLAQSNCRIPGNLKGKIHRTSFEEGGIKVSDFRNARGRRLHITRISNENEVLWKCPRQFLLQQSFFREYPCQNTRETSFLSRGTFGRHDDNVQNLTLYQRIIKY